MEKEVNKPLELSEQEIQDVIEMIEEESYSDDYETEWEGKVTYIRVNEDSDGVSAYYEFDEDGPSHSVSDAYEKYKLEVGDYTLEFKNYGDGNIDDLVIYKRCKCNLEDGALKDNLLSAISEIVSSEVSLPDDGSELFDADWTDEEVVEEIESQLSSHEYIEVNGTIYPADDWDNVVESVFGGEEPDEDSYTRMDKHEVAKDLAFDIDCGGW